MHNMILWYIQLVQVSFTYSYDICLLLPQNRGLESLLCYQVYHNTTQLAVIIYYRVL